MDLSVMRAATQSTNQEKGTGQAIGQQKAQISEANKNLTETRGTNEAARENKSIESSKRDFQAAQAEAKRDLKFDKMQGDISLVTQVSNSAFGLLNRFLG
jgi:hypothetical protein